MMNPSPWGGFMEGLAGGIKGGAEAYIEKQMLEIDQKQQASQARAKTNQDMFSNKDLPLKIRKQAWKNWLQENADWNTGITAPDFPDEMWEDKRLDAYLQRAIKIRDNKDYGVSDQIKFTKGLIAEAISVLGQSAETALKPVLSGMETEAFKLGVGGLGKGELTPKTIGLLSGSKAGRGMLAEQVKPVKVKTPAIPLYETMEIGNGKTQKMKWNPETKKHDIPYGKPVQGETASYHRIGSTLYEFKGGKSKVMQKGDLKGRAVVHAMREQSWEYSDEAEQYELIEKHMRLLKGTFSPSTASSATGMSPNMPQKKGLLGGALDYLFPKHAENLGFGAMGKEKDALLSGPKKPTVHQIKRPGQLTKEMAIKILRAAKGDKTLARKMAKEQGYSF